MPALPSVPNVVKVTVVNSAGADVDIINQFYIHYTGTAPTNGELVTFAGSIRSAWSSHLAAFVDSGRPMVTVECIDLSSPTGARGEDIGSTPGTRSGDALPVEVAAIGKYLIQRRYRGGHPRNYFPFGVDTDVASAQTWTDAFVNGLTSALAAFFTDLLTDGWSGAGTLTHVAVSFFEGFTNVLYPSGRYHVKPTPRSSPVVDPVLDYAVNPKFGSQRRRSQQSS